MGPIEAAQQHLTRRRQEAEAAAAFDAAPQAQCRQYQPTAPERGAEAPRPAQRLVDARLAQRLGANAKACQAELAQMVYDPARVRGVEAASSRRQPVDWRGEPVERPAEFREHWRTLQEEGDWPGSDDGDLAKVPGWVRALDLLYILFFGGILGCLAHLFAISFGG